MVLFPCRFVSARGNNLGPRPSVKDGTVVKSSRNNAEAEVKIFPNAKSEVKPYSLTATPKTDRTKVQTFHTDEMEKTEDGLTKNQQDSNEFEDLFSDPLGESAMAKKTSK